MTPLGLFGHCGTKVYSMGKEEAVNLLKTKTYKDEWSDLNPRSTHDMSCC